MAREIRKGDRIVGLGAVRAAAHVDASGVTWDTGIRESHEDIGRNAEHWRHENGEEIANTRQPDAVWVFSRGNGGPLKFGDDGYVILGPGDSLTMAQPNVNAAPCGERLALALFRTEPDVLAFCGRVGERHTVERSGGDTTFRTNETAFRRALNIAWERDESGWRTRAIARAEAVIAEMCR
jgi:hypothetical protein